MEMDLMELFQRCDVFCFLFYCLLDRYFLFTIIHIHFIWLENTWVTRGCIIRYNNCLPFASSWVNSRCCGFRAAHHFSSLCWVFIVLFVFVLCIWIFYSWIKLNSNWTDVVGFFCNCCFSSYYFINHKRNL